MESTINSELKSYQSETVEERTKPSAMWPSMRGLPGARLRERCRRCVVYGGAAEAKSAPVKQNKMIMKLEQANLMHERFTQISIQALHPLSGVKAQFMAKQRMIHNHVEHAFI